MYNGQKKKNEEKLKKMNESRPQNANEPNLLRNNMDKRLWQNLQHHTPITLLIRSLYLPHIAVC